MGFIVYFPNGDPQLINLVEPDLAQLQQFCAPDGVMFSTNP